MAEPKTHPLQSPWTFWYESRNRGSGVQQTQQEYEKSLKPIGTFDTLEGFWSYYAHLKRPSKLDKLSTYHLFRDEKPPTWENYVDGGHWLVTMRKSSDGDNKKLDCLWEQLTFSLIGEEFEDPQVVGAVVQIRMKEDVLSVWLAEKTSKFRVGEKIKQILHLGPSTVIEYKNNKSSMKDQSGLRNAQAYLVPGTKKSPPNSPAKKADTEEQPPATEGEAQQPAEEEPAAAPAATEGQEPPAEGKSE